MDYPVSRKCPKLLTKSELNRRASTKHRTNPDSLPIINEKKIPKVFKVTEDVSPHKKKEIANEDEKTHARSPGPSPFSNPRKRPHRLLPECDLNNSGFLGEDSAPLLKNAKAEKAQKPRTPEKPKGLTNSPYSLYDICNGKLRDVGVKKAEKKAKKVEDYFFGNSKLPGPNGDSNSEDNSSDEDDDGGLELFGVKKCQSS